MRKRRFFATAGEKRKFYQNVRHFGHTRDIGLAFVGVLPVIGVVAVLAFALIGMFTIGNAVNTETLRAGVHGKPHFMLETVLAIGGVGLSKARQMREDRKKVVTDAQGLIGPKGFANQEDRQKFDLMMKDADKMLEDIERIEKVEAAEAEIRTAPPEGRPGSNPTEDPEADQKKYRSAFRSYLKNGFQRSQFERGVTSEERDILLKFQDKETRDMGTGGGNALQGSGGGFFVPVGFVNDVEIALKFYGEMLQVATILPTDTGQPLPYPTANDTGVTGELVGENQQVTTNDVTLGNIVFNAYKYSTKMVKVSLELLQDSAFDLEMFLKDQFAIRLGRILNTHFTTGLGSGSSQPNGIITASVSGATAAGSATNDGSGATGANSIGSDDLVSLEHSVDRLYRRGARWMMHDSTLKAIKQLKDKYGRPLWLPGLAVNSPDTILQYPYNINNDMDTIATTKKTVLFGQLDKYMVRRVKDLSIIRLVERFADFGQVAFVGFARYDGNLLDAGTHPVKFLTQA